ncbi:MAG: hypothetical protein L0154_10915 [Chloroflexi bacterium]|nr:hypothetical protein [Chloroflexota bacterium]
MRHTNSSFVVRVSTAPHYTVLALNVILESRRWWKFRFVAKSPERFVRGEPLRRVHECVFGILALESEPVDPRL